MNKLILVIGILITSISGVQMSQMTNRVVGLEVTQPVRNYNEYRGYWTYWDIKYNDVLKGFPPGLEIQNIEGGIFKGVLNFRGSENRFSVNPSLQIEISEEIINDQVIFDFEDNIFGKGSGILTLNQKDITVNLILEPNYSAYPVRVTRDGEYVFKKIPAEYLSITTSPKGLLSYLEFNRDEMKALFGENYEYASSATNGGLSHQYKYSYPEEGLTFVFNDEVGEELGCIICDEKIKLNGASSGMNFEEIKDHLGENDMTEYRDSQGGTKYYDLFYRMKNKSIHFTSNEETGANATLIISNY